MLLQVTESGLNDETDLNEQLNELYLGRNDIGKVKTRRKDA
jgi:hypothetical protein